MNELLLPDIAGSYQQGYAFGNQAKTARKAEQDQNMLRGLAPQVIAGDPEAFAQAAAVDSDAAVKYDKAGDVLARQSAGLAKWMLDAYKGGQGDPAEVQRRYQEALPFLGKMARAHGQPAPGPTFDPASAPLMERFVADYDARRAGATGGQVQSTKIGNDGFYYTVDRNGNWTNSGIKANPNIKVLEQEGVVPYGVVTSGGVAGSVVPLGGASPGADATPMATAGAGPTATAVAIDGVPAQQQQRMAQTAALMRQAGYPDAEIDAFVNAQLSQPRDVPPAQFNAGGPVRTPTSAEKAAATTAAQEAAKLQYLPQELGMRMDAAVSEAAQKAQAEARIKREADLASAAQKKYVDASTTLGLLDEAEALIDKSTGSRVGAMRDDIAASFGGSTEGAQAIAGLQPIAASLTLAVPRMEGPQSDADRLLYQKAAGDFANPLVPVATRKASAAQMRRLAEKYKNTGGRPPSAGAPEPGVVQDGYRFRGGNPADPSSWERI